MDSNQHRLHYQCSVLPIGPRPSRMNRLQEPARLPGTAQPQNVSRETFGRAGRARPPKRALTVPLQFNDPHGFRLAEKSAARDSTNLSASSQFSKIPVGENGRICSLYFGAPCAFAFACLLSEDTNSRYSRPALSGMAGHPRIAFAKSSPLEAQTAKWRKSSTAAQTPSRA